MQLWAKDIGNGVTDIVMGSPEIANYVQRLPVTTTTAAGGGGGSDGADVVNMLRVFLLQITEKLGPEGVRMLVGAIFFLFAIRMLRRR